MSADIINFGDLQVRSDWKRQQQKQSKCRHRKIVYSLRDHSIECEECEAQLDPFLAFTLMVDQFKTAWRGLEGRERALKEAQEKNLHLIAAKRACEAWASKSMVPLCPHCSEAIFTTDGFGGSAVNKEIALRRRAMKAEQKAALAGNDAKDKT